MRSCRRQLKSCWEYGIKKGGLASLHLLKTAAEGSWGLITAAKAFYMEKLVDYKTWQKQFLELRAG